MATIKHKKAICAAEVSAFGGIDASAPCGDGGIAVDLKNFKVLPDGSLCRRNGFSVYRSFADDVRGAEVFADTNGTFLLAAVGSTVHRIPLGDGEDESADVLHSTEGEVTFFSFLGEIYLVDGLELYRLVDGALFEVCRGYVPLYGKNWNSEKTVNPINEPINLASDKVRFHYEAGTMFGTLYFGVRLASVERVVEGGTERFYERTLSEDGTSMTFKTAFRSTKPITVYATVDPSYFHDAELRACHGVAKYDAFGGSRVMLYGGGDGARIFISRPVNATSLAEAREEYPNATSLYIPKGGDMTLESRSPITAMARVGDRMMIATANETWISETVSDVAETETVLPLRSLSRTVGGLGAGGLAVTGGDAPSRYRRAAFTFGRWILSWITPPRCAAFPAALRPFCPAASRRAFALPTCGERTPSGFTTRTMRKVGCFFTTVPPRAGTATRASAARACWRRKGVWASSVTAAFTSLRRGAAVTFFPSASATSWAPTEAA